ncbi:PiggyBac transposable element-derived protein 4 [Anthophora retusa]
MIKFKERHSINQYLPKKPIKRGYNKFDMYTGKINNQVTKNLGEKVVDYLTDDVGGKEHKLFFDNYFTSVILIENLKENKINACGVVNKARKFLPSFAFHKNKKREEYMSFVSNRGINATKWIDNREIYLLSNYHVPNQVETVQRKDKNRDKISVACPSLITLVYKLKKNF